MSLVNIIHMDVLEHTQAPFSSPISFDITFECCQELPDDLEWKVVYVGSPECNLYDQVLEEVQVGPIPVGLHKFNLQAPCPSLERIPLEHRLGVTVLLVTASYRQQEFCRIGYYVLNELIPELQQQQPQQTSLSFEQQPDMNAMAMTNHADTITDHPITTTTNDEALVIVVDDASMLMRTILADKPRVTRYHIAWQQGDDLDNADNNNNSDIHNNNMMEVVNKERHDAAEGDEEHDHEDEQEDEEDDEDDNMSSSSMTSDSSNISMEETTTTTTTESTPFLPLPPPQLSKEPSVAAFTIPMMTLPLSPKPTLSHLVSPCHDAIRNE